MDMKIEKIINIWFTDWQVSLVHKMRSGRILNITINKLLVFVIILIMLYFGKV